MIYISSKLSVIFLFIFVLSLVSCDKDKDSVTQNSIKLDGNSFEINTATIMGVSIGGDGHAGISFTTAATVTKTLTIDFEYAGNQIIEGEYSFPDNGTKLLDDWLTNYTEMSGTDIYSTELKNGTVSVKHNSDNNYTVIMDLTMLDGKVFSGTYTGDFMVQFNDN